MNYNKQGWRAQKQAKYSDELLEVVFITTVLTVLIVGFVLALARYAYITN